MIRTKLEHATKHLGPIHPDVQKSVEQMASLMVEQGRFEDTIDYYTKSIQLDPYRYKQWKNFEDLARVLGKAGGSKGAKRLLQKLLNIKEGKQNKHPPIV